MTIEALQIVTCIFNICWRLFTSWVIPGTNITPMEMALFLVVGGMSIRFIKRVTFEPVEEEAIDSSSHSVSFGNTHFIAKRR